MQRPVFGLTIFPSGHFFSIPFNGFLLTLFIVFILIHLPVAGFLTLPFGHLVLFSFILSKLLLFLFM